MNTLPVISNRPTRNVPCGTCTACCQGDAIFMHPECGDDPSQYETEMYEGRVILKHKPNGDCIYLDRAKGCTIHERRPAICRELDCRELIDAIGEYRAQQLGLDRILSAAWRLRRDGVGSAPTAGQ